MCRTGFAGLLCHPQVMEIVRHGRTLMLSGDFDVRTTSEVRGAINEHLARCGEGVVFIDMSKVGAVDVTALRVLAAASQRATARGQQMTLRGCGPAVRRMLHLSHLIRVIDVERAAVTA